MVEGHKIEKDMIFYNPGKSGSVFTYKSGHVVNDSEIHDMMNLLEYDTEQKVAWVEERRASQRSV
jgi:hypothetical protein